MAFVVTNTHTLQCLHGGTVTKVPAPKLVVGGQPVLTGVGPVTTCPLPPPMGSIKCTTVTVTAGKATKLTVGGTAVLLSTLAAKADAPPASPGGLLSFVPAATPTKLNAV